MLLMYFKTIKRSFFTFNSLKMSTEKQLEKNPVLQEAIVELYLVLKIRKTKEVTIYFIDFSYR